MSRSFCDEMKSYYYYWLIPSLISFLASSCVLVDVVYLSRRVSKKPLSYLDWRTVLFAIADLVQTSTWFLGDRKDHEGDLCRAQEYLFQASTLSKVFICVVSSGIMSYAVRVRKLPEQQVIKYCEFGLVCLLFVLMSLLIYYDGSRPMCLLTFERDLTQTSGLIFLFAFMIPLTLSFFATVIMTFPTFVHQDIAKSVLKSILERLLPIPVIFSLCFVPSLILAIVVFTTSHKFPFLFCLTAICASSSGWIFSIFQFFLIGEIRRSPTVTVSLMTDNETGHKGSTDHPMTYQDSSSYFGGD